MCLHAEAIGAPEEVTGYILNFGYEGMLPYEATVSHNVGKDLAGKTLFLYHVEDNTKYVDQRPIVDKNGYVDVEITECSSRRSCRVCSRSSKPTGRAQKFDI